MPRIIATTSFEDLGYMNLPLFDFKLLRLTPRQMIVLFVFVGLAYMGFTSTEFIFSDVLTRAFVAVAIFAVGAAFFARRGRVFAPEWYLLYFARKAFGFRVLKFKRAGAKRAPKESAEVPEARAMVAPLGEPTRIAGVLFDPSTGKRLSNAAYEVRVDGKPYYSGRTDKDGAYSIVFTPPAPGRFAVAIKPKGQGRNAEEISIEASATPGTGQYEPTARGQLRSDVRPREEVQTARGKDVAREMAAEPTYIYELFPMNFVDLPDKEQDRIVDNFREFLNSLDGQVKITIARSSKEVALGDSAFEAKYFRFFIQSKEPIDAQLETAGLNYQRTTESPEPKITRAFKSFAAVEGGQTLQTATICELPPTLTEGFPCELYRYVDRITLTVTPLTQEDAVLKLDKFWRLKSGTAFGGRAQQREITEGQRAQEALSRVTTGGSRLFMLIANIAVGGSTAAELKERMKRVRSYCRGKQIQIGAPMFVQADLLRGGLGKRLYVESITLGAFFPFVSADMIETPGGVCLGLNRATGAPVVFDPYLRMNQNMAFIGMPGAGKSFAAKTFLTRLVEHDPDASFFVIDPENEYPRTALEVDMTCQVTHVGRERDLGLDPFTLFPDSKDLILDVLANLLGLSEESDLLSELRVGVQRSCTLKELRQHTGAKLRKRLDGLLKGPEGFLFRGAPMTIKDRAVFSFKELHQALRVSGQRTGALHLASLLIFGKIWKRIEEMPRDRLKVVIVDEVWLYSAIPASASFLNHISRRGRKRNVTFVLCSQRPEDVLGSEDTRAAIQNCATKVIFNQDESSVDLVRKNFGLTEREAEDCVNFSSGEAILLSRGIRVPVYFKCSPSEYALFTTKPKESA